MAKTKLSASIQEKNNRLHAVIITKENGKTKPVWRALGLPKDTSRTQVNKKFREVVEAFEEEYEERLARGGRPSANIPVYDYMKAHLEKTKRNIKGTTYDSYHGMIEGKIKAYFTKRPHLMVGNLKPRDIEAFYEYVFSFNVKSTTVLHYHVVMHKAFKQAFMDEMIDVNPFDRVTRPKKEKFEGAHYSEEELLTLLSLVKEETIYPAIVIASCLGVRRGEAVGMRWSRINWEQKTVLLDTNVSEINKDGKKCLVISNEMKTQKSKRTLPLPEPVIEMLKEQRIKQEGYKKMFKKSYSREYTDFVCVNQFGELIKPNYVTNRFRVILKKCNMRHIRFHDLRHTFASLLIAHQTPLIEVSHFLGHSDLSTTANIYTHLDTESKKQSAEVITNIFNEER